jgi:hypothetical protein
MLMPLRRCALYLGMPYQTLINYWLRMQYEVPYVVNGCAKLVDPDQVRSYLQTAGYKFKLGGLQDVTYHSIDEPDLYADPQSMHDGIEAGMPYEDEPDLYLDPQAMLDGIETGALYEDVE